MTVIDTIKKKQKCHSCKKKSGLLTPCKFCDKKFCFNCIQYEVHGCEETETMKETKRRHLQDKLESEKCVRVKIESI